jgi:hypothetical protein
MSATAYAPVMSVSCGMMGTLAPSILSHSRIPKNSLFPIKDATVCSNHPRLGPAVLLAKVRLRRLMMRIGAIESQDFSTKPTT